MDGLILNRNQADKQLSKNIFLVAGSKTSRQFSLARLWLHAEKNENKKYFPHHFTEKSRPWSRL